MSEVLIATTGALVGVFLGAVLARSNERWRWRQDLLLQGYREYFKALKGFEAVATDLAEEAEEKVKFGEDLSIDRLIRAQQRLSDSLQDLDLFASLKLSEIAVEIEEAVGLVCKSAKDGAEAFMKDRRSGSGADQALFELSTEYVAAVRRALGMDRAFKTRLRILLRYRQLRHRLRRWRMRREHRQPQSP